MLLYTAVVSYDANYLSVLFSRRGWAWRQIWRILGRHVGGRGSRSVRDVDMTVGLVVRGRGRRVVAGRGRRVVVGRGRRVVV